MLKEIIKNALNIGEIPDEWPNESETTEAWRIDSFLFASSALNSFSTCGKFPRYENSSPNVRKNQKG